MNNQKTNKIISKLKRSKLFRQIKNEISDFEDVLTIKNAAGSLPSVIITLLRGELANPIVIVCASVKDAGEIRNDLSLFVDDKEIIYLVKPEKNVRFQDDIQEEQLGWLVEGLSRVNEIDSPVIITTPDIFEIKIPGKQDISAHKITVSVGDNIEFEKFTNNLALNGFERNDYVASQGEMAVRGGIVDIFPVGWDNPVRLDFWGDQVESIREFSPMSQRSINDHKSITFIESVFYSDDTERTDTIDNFLAEETLVVFNSPETFPDDDEITAIVSSIAEKYAIINMNSIRGGGLKLHSAPQPGFNSSIKEFCTQLSADISAGMTYILCAEGKIHLERFSDIVKNSLTILDEENKLPENIKPDDIFDSVIWLNEAVSKGFILNEDGLALITEHEIFGRVRVKKSRGGKKSPGMTLRELKQLKIGDYIVHDDKGIGRFDGFETVEIGGNRQDCARIIYAGGDLLYVHLNYLHKVRPYEASEGVTPKLNKLGTTEWARKKARTKKKLKDIARDLIKLYAERKMQPGFAFSSDNVWQKEFEASFIYEDTPDQATATSDIKKDMESETPMDRLVCGDVGFGKTEVAIRAAFKTVQSGKQVAVLVPTTILAQQHYMTFRDRLAKYPVIPEVISRFRKKADQTKILQNLEKGGVDILIGTHRMLSKDINFKDLGLLIIDEEQRFGVSSKEKLRSMRAAIDTLTLTATPIPRTLNFSLMGARDLSIITTPPRNRIPVQTEVMEWNEEFITEVINKEIERKGQVFFVSDKVKDIEKIRDDLQELMPHVRFAVAHGQMKASQLESVMQKFIKRKYDVLISTKIVESGLDIPNANTMIINRAQMFGLAELYQLRGRVGRANKQAYCYLLIPPFNKLNENALQRLQAIEEFTDLGSGFQLALRDLEIRGAGDMLGPEQSGYINEMGFELYQKILDEAVGELRTEEFSELFAEGELPRAKMLQNEDIAIELGTDALLPKDYVKNEADRFSFYKRLYNSSNNAELQEIVEELTDRFGKLPRQAQELVFAVKVRIAALYTGFIRIMLRKGRIVCELPSKENAEYYAKAFPVIAEYMNDMPGSKLKQAGPRLLLTIPVESRDDSVAALWKIKKTLEIIE